jgi:hypothetical protein
MDKINLKTNAMIEHLINQKAIEFYEIDEDGQMLYKITEKLQSVSPELYEDLRDQYEEHMFKLIDEGPIAMTWRING